MITSEIQSTVVRTGRGLTVAGTRITLYDIVGYFKEGWPPKLVGQWLNLSEEQMADVMDYLAVHRNEVEAEYQLVLAQAEKARAYWDERNRELDACVATLPPPPGKDDLLARLRARKAELGMR